MGKMSKKTLENRKKDFIAKMNDPNYYEVNSYQSSTPKNRTYKSFSDAEDLARI